MLNYIFTNEKTKYPIRYDINEIYTHKQLSSLSAQIELDPFIFGWQSFSIRNIIQRARQHSSSTYFGLTLKPSLINNNRRQIKNLQIFSVYTPFLVVYSNDTRAGGDARSIFEEFIPSNLLKSANEYENFENYVQQSNNNQSNLNKPEEAETIPIQTDNDTGQRIRFKRANSYRHTTSTTVENDLLLPEYNDTFSNRQDQCSLKPFIIDFSDFGWSEWVIQPQSYMANLCSGLCDEFLQSSITTNHALLQNLLRRLGIRSGLPSVCCTVEKYSPLVLFYKSSEHLYSIRLLSNMIIDSCHCR